MPKTKILDLDIVIVNWNSGSHLFDCLTSIDARVRSVIIVDNASTDNSLKDISTFKDLPINLVRNKRNAGFAKGCNIGMRHSQAKTVLFLNPDVILSEGALAKSYEAFKYRQDASIMGIQLRDKHNNVTKTCANFPRSYRILSQILGLDRILPIAPRHFMSKWDHKSSRFVPQVMGAFFMTSRLTYDQLGGFDERFFIYYEEVDFAYRAFQKGLRSYFFADVYAYHFGGGSSSKVKDKRLFYSLQSRILYAFKHFGWGDAWLVLLATLFIEPITRSVHLLLSFERGSLKVIGSAYKMLFKNIKKIVKNAYSRSDTV